MVSGRGAARLGLAQTAIRAVRWVATAGTARRRREVRTALLADVHHDLGNTLRAATLQLELLCLHKDGVARELADSGLERCRSAMMRMDELLVELEGLVHGLSAHETMQATDVAALVRETAALFEGEARLRGLQIETEAGAEARVAVASRPLFRVLANLLGNAVKYATADTVIDVSVTPGAELVRLVVADRGPGIAPHHCARLFDREWMASSSLRRGRGLGLAIVRRVVEAHGGRIVVDSKLGRGTRFTVELPAACDVGAEPRAERRP